MKKLNLDALKERAEAIASEELLNTISGGMENKCHVVAPKEKPKHVIICDNI